MLGLQLDYLDSLVETIKSKVGLLRRKKKKPYIKMDKSSSVRVEIRIRPEISSIRTLKLADRPGQRALS
ncbi:LOW QUALITY PROTEIN: hypothetical protein HID58_043670 [Brassica napus]|uniref:Uncharacterized protein n=1 Tax=Brassica napus TaxID=3708 RepID=A0ABQ8BH55_BRANA|nr:LOW QUALITY PROTEIN: hypothetical protein HID58_043670 [Brassica napus]